MYSFEAANTCSELYHKATSIFSILYSFDSNLITTVINGFSNTIFIVVVKLE